MSGHLSLLHLDAADQQVRVDLRDVSELHRTLMSAFADVGGANGRARAELGVLFRVSPEDERTTVLVQSQVRPRWDDLPRGYLDRAAEVRPLEPLLDRITYASIWRFRLTANATVTNNQTRSRRGLTREADLVEWLSRKSAQIGAQLSTNQQPTFTARDLGTISGRRGAQKITLRQALFEGVLRVEDAGVCKAALISGIGRGRAYGCGLLTLAPVG